jgi:hypothetical protein
MRVGTTLDKTSCNPYLAARAVFLELKKGVFKEGNNKGEAIKDHIKTLAFPGLGIKKIIK